MASYRGTEPPEEGRRRWDMGPPQPYDERSTERRQLFIHDPAAFTDIVMQDVGAEPADLQSLIAVMNPAQLATSLQHMALQYRDLQNAATGIWDTDEDDDRVPRTPGQWPAPSGSEPGRTHGRDAPKPTRDYEEEHAFPGEYTPRHMSGHDEMPHLTWHTATTDDEEPNTDDPPPTPRATRSAPSATKRQTPQQAAEATLEEPVKGSNSRQRMPAAKLETFAGQGASVESFLAKFESHAAYFGCIERDRVFQLKNSLTGTAAQAL